MAITRDQCVVAAAILLVLLAAVGGIMWYRGDDFAPAPPVPSFKSFSKGDGPGNHAASRGRFGSHTRVPAPASQPASQPASHPASHPANSFFPRLESRGTPGPVKPTKDGDFVINGIIPQVPGPKY